MRRLAFALLLALAACQQDPPAQGARDTSVPALTVEGYGDVRVGMTIEEARQVTGQPLNNEALEPDIPGACSEQQYFLPSGDQLWLMFEEDRITRITASDEAQRTRTDQNIGFGSTDEEVRTAYQNVIQQPAPYGEPPAHDLIVWTVPNQTGLRFEIDHEGHVSAVHAGTASILYSEGCA